ncbi:hypothetical protein EV06_0833 [Prochlorococcus sp. MIT 0602]|nr:hypothetical protein EV06_0833 [Prochlorococcus sp. MIT 0602]KGG17242.1 hypothetical protein EV07_0679 [Prochlorococcus sp. MIT 0603]
MARSSKKSFSLSKAIFFAMGALTGQISAEFNCQKVAWY